MRVTVVDECRSRLLESKKSLLNNLNSSTLSELGEDRGGDLADLNVRNLTETEWVLFQSRTRRKIFEIEAALSRIQSGTFGICEETGLPIESKRLLALPWTRLSIDGATSRESFKL